MKLKSLCCFIVTSFSLMSSCSNNIIVNNVFVYLVHEGCTNMGSINGNQWQPVFVNSYSDYVTAVPANNYVFLQWSDGVKEATRHDLATEQNSSGPVYIYAYFEKVN